MAIFCSGVLNETKNEKHYGNFKINGPRGC